MTQEHPVAPPVSIKEAKATKAALSQSRCDCSSIDLSAGAAHRLGVPIDGIATVSITH